MILPWRDVGVGGGHTISTSLTMREVNRLGQLAHGHYVLEIGSAFGYSATQMARTARHVLAVDPHAGELTDSYTVMQENIRRHAPGSVTILRATSAQALPLLQGVGAKFGLIFIDGDHSTSGVQHDFQRALKLLRPGAAIACHDYGEDTCPGVKLALDSFRLSPHELVDTLWVRHHSR